MLKFNKQEIYLIFEGLKCLMNTKKYSHKDIMPLVNKMLETGKIDTSRQDAFKIPESVNEELQLHDKVKYDKQTGFITGEINGKFIVMIQGRTYLVDPKELKEYSPKPEITTKPHMKFDEETQKAHSFYILHFLITHKHGNFLICYSLISFQETLI